MRCKNTFIALLVLMIDLIDFLLFIYSVVPIFIIKGMVHPQNIFLKYVMLRTEMENLTIIITRDIPDIIDIGK